MMEFLPQPRIFIEDAAPEDIDAMVPIHAAGFLRGWSADEFETLLSDRMVTVLVLRRESILGHRRLLGFVVVRSVAGESEILTLAVDPARRGRGHGRKLMEEAIRRLYRDRVPELFLEVDEDNAPAVALYRSLGFVEVGRRKGYYAGGDGRSGTALVLRLAIDDRPRAKTERGGP